MSERPTTVDYIEAINLARSPNPTEKRVLFVLLQHVNWATGRCFPSMERIAELADLSDDRSARRVVGRLVTRGMVHRVGNSAGGRGRSTVYELDIEALRADSKRGTVESPFEATKGDRAVRVDDGKGGPHGAQTRTLRRINPDPAVPPTNQELTMNTAAAAEGRRCRDARGAGEQPARSPMARPHVASVPRGEGGGGGTDTPQGADAPRGDVGALRIEQELILAGVEKGSDRAALAARAYAAGVNPSDVTQAWERLRTKGKGIPILLREVETLIEKADVRRQRQAERANATTTKQVDPERAKQDAEWRAWYAEKAERIRREAENERLQSTERRVLSTA